MDDCIKRKLLCRAGSPVLPLLQETPFAAASTKRKEVAAGMSRG